MLEEGGHFDRIGLTIQEMKEYAGIKTSTPKFGQDNREFTMDKKNNMISYSMKNVKNVSKQVSQELYEIGKNNYNNFVELLVEFDENTSLNKTKINTLIKIDYFSEFGGIRKLLKIFDAFRGDDGQKIKYSKTHKDRTKEKRIELLTSYEDSLKDEDASIKEKVGWQLEFLGYCDYKNPDLDKRHVVVTQLDTKYSPKFIGYCLNNGKAMLIKVSKSAKKPKPNTTYFSKIPFEDGDILYINKFEEKEDVRKGDTSKGEKSWVGLGTKTWWATNYKKIEI